MESFDAATACMASLTVGALAVGGAVYQATKAPDPMEELPFPMSKALDDEGFMRTSLTCLENDPKYAWFFKEIKTGYDVFQYGRRTHDERICLQYKRSSNDTEYVSYTYDEVDHLSLDIGSGIVRSLLNDPDNPSDKVGVMMKNCLEWVLLDQCSSRYSLVTVPLYDTLGDEACLFIINDTKIQVVFLDSTKKLEFIVQNQSKLTILRYVVMKTKSEEAVKLGEKLTNIKVMFFQDVMENGRKNPVEKKLAREKDVYTICYTSGTTGIPKGCVLTHEKFFAIVSTALVYLDAIRFDQDEQETHFSFLPLTHVFERLAHAMYFVFGGRIVFFSGDMKNLLNEIQAVKPTILFSVPRLLNRIYDKMMLEINKNRIVKYIFNKGLESKGAEVDKGIIRQNSVWDYLVFNRIRQVLGGKVRLITVSSAPISPTTLKFFRVTMGCIVVEAYGQSETCGPCTMTLLGDHEPGQVGVPVPGITIHLLDVPDLDLVVSRDKRGEICIQGDRIISEYFNNPEMTQKLIDKDGWLHTGDVGTWTEKGQLKIVDRCKHMFKLSQGEYLAPERLENVYTLSPLISQIYVTGSGLRDYCVALVLPDLEGWNSSYGYDESGHNSEIIKKRQRFETEHEMWKQQDNKEYDIKGILLRELNKIGRTNGLLGFEIVKKLALIKEPMTPENGLLSPTLKLKRAVAHKTFHNEIEEIYKLEL